MDRYAMRLVLDARSASFGALIDDASLLGPKPPIMDDAVSAYRSARIASSGWMIGRFLCPTSRLTDLAASLTRSLEAGEEPWEIGTVFDGDTGESASAAQAFHTEMQPAATIAAAEARITGTEPTDIGAVIDAIASIQPEVVPFLELDQPGLFGDHAMTIASELSRRSMVGGVQIGLDSPFQQANPTVDSVAAFIMEATTHRLPFRTSTGIEAPIRHYADDLWHHGFINLLVAAAAAGQGQTFDTVADIVAETDPGAFSMGAAFISCRGVSIPGPTMRRIRAIGFIAFGSQDLASTIEALRDLGFLSDGT